MDFSSVLSEHQKRSGLWEGQSSSTLIKAQPGIVCNLVLQKGVCQGCILSPCLFNLYTEYIMRNVGLDEAQAGIEIAGEKYQ